MRSLICSGVALGPSTLVMRCWFTTTAIEPGRAEYRLRPQEFHFNPAGTLHGGVMATIVDSAMSCALWSTLEAGIGWTTMELKLGLLRTVTLDAGELVCVGTLINAGAFIIVVALVVLFGLKPMTTALTKKPETPSFDEVQRSLAAPDGSVVAEPGAPGVAALPGMNAPNPLEDLRQRLKPAPQERLARMVDLNEERTAQILRKWARQEAA